MIATTKDIEKLKDILGYNPNTGIFTWNKPTVHRVRIGDIAGTKRSNDGYTQIMVYKKAFLAHRLAWAFMEGYWPEQDIDHIDRDPGNNKWENLRHVSHSCNMKNQKIHKTNTSGVSGVYWNKRKNKWHVRIPMNSKQIHLGYYKSLTKAAYHRWKAECKYNWNNCNTTSSSYLYLKNKGLIK